MEKIKSISIVLPAYNEEANIENTVKDVITFIEDMKFNYEIIIVNDGSRDQTGEIINNIVSMNANVILVHHFSNKGYGGALKSGFSKATKGWVFFMDSDGQFRINELQNFFQYTDRYDLIIGYRKNRRDKLIRLINAKLFNLLIRFLFGVKVRDIDCAFKLIRRDFLKEIDIESNGAFINSELLFKADKDKKKIKELPVSHYSRNSGKPTGASIKVILRAMCELLTFKLTGRVL